MFVGGRGRSRLFEHCLMIACYRVSITRLSPDGVNRVRLFSQSYLVRRHPMPFEFAAPASPDSPFGRGRIMLPAWRDLLAPSVAWQGVAIGDHDVGALE